MLIILLISLQIPPILPILHLRPLLRRPRLTLRRQLLLQRLLRLRHPLLRLPQPPQQIHLLLLHL